MRQWDEHMAATFDKELYSEQDLIAIKIPLLLPYQTGQSDCERVDGEITIDGQLYKYVKRKVVNGELILLCLPDRYKARLQTVKDNFFKLTNNLQATSSSKKPVHARSLSFNDIVQDYDKVLLQWLLPIFFHSSQTTYYSHTDKLISRWLSTPEPPPDFYIEAVLCFA